MPGPSLYPVPTRGPQAVAPPAPPAEADHRHQGEAVCVDEVVCVQEPPPAAGTVTPPAPQDRAGEVAQEEAGTAAPPAAQEGDGVAPQECASDGALEDGARGDPDLAREVLERALSGPNGLGTAGLHLARRAQPLPPCREIPGLYYHPVPEPDAVRVAEVGRRIKDWAVDEVELYPPEWEDQFDGFSLGRYMVACHPDALTIDHLMVATRLMAAENAVDDCYCEDHGGSPVGLGGRLLMAHTALDPVHTTKEYEGPWADSLHSDAPRRAYRSAMDYFLRAASASQADRFRHDMARLHMGYLAEAAWAQTDHVPEVWEYLAMRQFNNFRPCPTITDTVGGYELPADLHAQPAMQRVIALASNATTIVNDLYSYTKELAAPGRHMNLPVVLAERESLGERDAYLKAIEIHNDLMRAFEAEAAALALACPVPQLTRFLRGVATWVDGNHHWHQTNTYRYGLPDFW
ncbi:family 2 encapsulin nanocompartment cargo protein terpene cyclase [Streptomyces crystallinus]|uniref:Terpene synthase n=1 Tax=Streptomyces crystallinus TaxID=68191 RepID=A0ABP3QU74_9ACTN